MKPTEPSKPSRLSEHIEDLVDTWNDWMTGNSIALDKNNFNAVKGVAARFCETKIKLRYYFIECIDETFEQRINREADKRANS